MELLNDSTILINEAFGKATANSLAGVEVNQFSVKKKDTKIIRARNQNQQDQKLRKEIRKQRKTEKSVNQERQKEKQTKKQKHIAERRPEPNQTFKNKETKKQRNKYVSHLREVIFDKVI